uniref:CAPA-Periviscerokinin-1 n=1 Tax=Karoophasma botterkloofense TaxID=253132 RepID=PVK1_KARBO|nr:RecName: Full=CAPA-Periviscerokinin-1; Short=CAPA-PVK-1 [Karoophasma botterkloofense]
EAAGLIPFPRVG